MVASGGLRGKTVSDEGAGRMFHGMCIGIEANGFDRPLLEGAIKAVAMDFYPFLDQTLQLTTSSSTGKGGSNCFQLVEKPPMIQLMSRRLVVAPPPHRRLILRKLTGREGVKSCDLAAIDVPGTSSRASTFHTRVEKVSDNEEKSTRRHYEDLSIQCRKAVPDKITIF